MHARKADYYVHLQTVNLYTYRELPEFGDEKSGKTVQDFSWFSSSAQLKPLCTIHKAVYS